MSSPSGLRTALVVKIAGVVGGTLILRYVWKCYSVRRRDHEISVDMAAQESSNDQDSQALHTPSVDVMLNLTDLSIILETHAPTVMAFLGMLESWRARPVSATFLRACDTFVRALQISQACDFRNTSCGTAAESFFGSLDAVREEADVHGVAIVFQAAKTVPGLVEIRDCAGRSPLMRVAQSGRTRQLVEALLVARADLQSQGGNGWRALHYAAVGGNLHLCHLLLDRRADIDARSKDGFSALAYARESGRECIAMELLQRGADPCQFDKKEGGGGVATEG